MAQSPLTYSRSLSHGSPHVQGQFRPVLQAPILRGAPGEMSPQGASRIIITSGTERTDSSGMIRMQGQPGMLNPSPSATLVALPSKQSWPTAITREAGGSQRAPLAAVSEGCSPVLPKNIQTTGSQGKLTALPSPLSQSRSVTVLSENVPPPPEPFGNAPSRRQVSNESDTFDIDPALRRVSNETTKSSRSGRWTRRSSGVPDGVFDIEFERSKDRDLTGQHSVMSWLGWSPQQQSPCYKALHEHFPGALPAPVVHARIRSAVGSFGLTAKNTLFGSSTCPDEINSEPGGLVALMEDAWGEVFPMGGISGVPFAGKTGFMAFSHHVPDDGHVLVLFGPHVGVSEDGEIGKVRRCGQCAKSTACGAIIGAFNSCLGKSSKDDEFDPTDMQMDWIKQHVKPVADKINEEPEPMAALAHQSYTFVEEEILKVVNTKFGIGNLVLVGGIMINMPHQHSMHFLPRFFEVRRQGAQPTNLMEAFEFRCHDPCLRSFVNDVDDEVVLKAKILGSLKPFQDTSTFDRLKAARSLVQMSYYKDETIINQGEIGNTFCILIAGEVVVEVDGKKVSRLSGLLRLEDDDIETQVHELSEGRTLPLVATFGEVSLVGGHESRHKSTIRVVSKYAIIDMMTRSQFLLLNKKDEDGEIVDGNSITFNFQSEKQKDASHVTSQHLFSHMGWSPSFETECFRALHEFFPGALPSHAIYSRFLRAITGERFGLTPANTIFGTSVCPDEINTKRFSLPQLMKSYWGKCFPLGGISGTPFAGKTGFTAFSHHVPENGNVIVLFGPHVGVSASGEVGKVHRDGQRCESTSCGAVVGAYKACLDTNFCSEDFDASDMQMDWIKSRIGPKVKFLKGFKNPLAMLSHYAFEMVQSKIRQVVNNEFGTGYLVLIGGIQINMPEPYCEHFLPYMFEVSKRGESGHVNLKSVFDSPS